MKGLLNVIVLLILCDYGYGQIVIDLFPPVATDDTGVTTKNVALNVNVVANDYDPDALGGIDVSTVDLNTAQDGIQNTRNTAQGSYTVNASGLLIYTPTNNFTGEATIDYTVDDNSGKTSNVASVTITVNTPGNVAPIAIDDIASTTTNTAVTLNVVANDTDSDGSINATTVDLNPTQTGIQNSRSTSKGDYDVNASGIVTYTPSDDFTGNASITYTVNDNEGATSNIANIEITVDPAPNSSPVAVDDNVTTTVNTFVTVNVVSNDTDSDGTIDPTTVDLNISQGGIQNSRNTPNGNYSVDASGIVTYTPANNFTGTTSVTYSVKDDDGATSNVATISVTVNSTSNNSPVAVDDDATTLINTAVTVNVVTNDTDSDGTIDPSTVDLNTSQGGIQNSRNTSDGNYSVNASGVVTYTPANNFTGSTSVTYTVKDNDGALSNVATIGVTVNSTPNNSPVAVDDDATTMQNVIVTFNVIVNDTDDDGTINPSTVDLNLVQTGIQNARNINEGYFEVNDSGVVTYAPANNFTGTASIDYSVKDNAGNTSNAATISVVVTSEPVNNLPPVITDFEPVVDTIMYDVGSRASRQLTAMLNVSDPDDEYLMSAEVGFRAENYSDVNDRLQFTKSANISGTFNDVTGILKIEGEAQIQEYVEVIRSVKYSYVNQVELNLKPRRIYVRLSDGKSFSESKERIIVLNELSGDLDIPTGFTPNGDGANETWKITPRLGIERGRFDYVEVRVYDKRGLLMHSSTGLDKNWDGTHNGKELPTGTYYYIISSKENQIGYKGTVTILR